MFPSNAGRSPQFTKRVTHLPKRVTKRVTQRASLSDRKAHGAGSAHGAGIAREIIAPAKLNLYLEVLGARADGFHALETLMVPVRVYDQLAWRENTPSESPTSLTLQIRSIFALRGKAKQLSGDPLLGQVDTNLVLRAARLLAKTAGIAPHGHFALIKRIPIQAGMGGGSSDAAAALVLANEVWGIGYSQRQLLPLAAQLGSDVPFFLSRYFARHGAAVCRGRGEIVEPVARLPRLHFVVVQPTRGLSTAEVFAELPQSSKTGAMLAKISQARLSGLIENLQHGNIAAAGQVMTNRLEFAAARLAPWLEELRRIFMKLGCCGQFLTGSGSAYVGVMRSATQARSVARRLNVMNSGAMNSGARNSGAMSSRAGASLGNVFATSNC